MSNLSLWGFLIYPMNYNLFENAFQKIRSTNNLVAMETIDILDSNKVIVRPLNTLSDYEYNHQIRTEEDPENRVDFLSRIVGLFINPNQIFVDTQLDAEEIERTIVHEVQHYRNHLDDPTIDEKEDEMLAIEAEDRYSGRYITRLYMRELKERVDQIFMARNS